MGLVGQRGKLQIAAAGALLVWVLLTLGCSRPGTFHSGDAASASSPEVSEVPFSPVDNKSDLDAGRQQENTLPLSSYPGLPVGTLLTVRLTAPVWTDAPDAAGTFEAVVDEAITIEGTTFISRGVNASGRVESARASSIKSNRNYVRLTLNSINLAGRDFPIQTSSLFARGRSSISAADENRDSPAVIHLDKGRRLTFRLTEPVYVASQKLLSTP
jgi:hypothetical protein